MMREKFPGSRHYSKRVQPNQEFQNQIQMLELSQIGFSSDQLSAIELNDYLIKHY